MYCSKSLVVLPTAYVSTREVNVLTRVCPSICLSTPGGGVPQPGPAGGGGTPARSDQGRVPLLGGTHLRYPPSQTWLEGYPTLGTPCQTWLGGVPLLVGSTPAGGYPTLGYPPSDLAQGVTLSDLAQGVPLLGVPHLGYHPSPLDLAGGVPHLGWST